MYIYFFPLGAVRGLLTPLQPHLSRAIAANSRDFLDRSTKINETAEKLADWLRERAEVENVYYPKFTQSELYTPFMTEQDDKVRGGRARANERDTRETARTKANGMPFFG